MDVSSLSAHHCSPPPDIRQQAYDTAATVANWQLLLVGPFQKLFARKMIASSALYGTVQL